MFVGVRIRGTLADLDPLNKIPSKRVMGRLHDTTRTWSLGVRKV